MKDVTIKDSAPRKLLLQKHIDYIAAYGTKKDDYVSSLPMILLSVLKCHNQWC